MRGRIFTRLFLILVLFLLPGCPTQDRKWKHYQSGGSYAGGSPSVSPDGFRIVLSSPVGESSNIYTIAPDGTDLMQLTDADEPDFNPVYSPDGKWIAFERETAEGRMIWLMAADGTDQRSFVDSKVTQDLVGFTHDSKYLMIGQSDPSYGLGRSVDYSLVPLEEGESGVISLKGFPLAIPNETGDVLVNQYDSNTKTVSVWLFDPHEEKESLICNGSALTISPNGNNILVSSADQTKWKVVGLHDRSESTLDNFEVPEWGEPHFSNDGEFIVFGREFGQQIWSMRIDGSELKQIPLPGGAFNFRDRGRCSLGVIGIAYEQNNRLGTIYLLDTATWKFKRIVSLANPAETSQRN